MAISCSQQETRLQCCCCSAGALITIRADEGSQPMGAPLVPWPFCTGTLRPAHSPAVGHSSKSNSWLACCWPLAHHNHLFSTSTTTCPPPLLSKTSHPETSIVALILLSSILHRNNSPPPPSSLNVEAFLLFHVHWQFECFALDVAAFYRVSSIIRTGRRIIITSQLH
jgi:hypothetical protein